jgi:hypothetical protein
MLVFLVWGDVTNGAPTHHPERALLPCWLAALIVCALQLSRFAPTLPGVSMKLHPALSAAAFGCGLWWQLPGKGFVDRSAELTLGATFAPRLGHDARMWVETAGYGYVAVSVGTTQPWLVDGFNPGDPRQLQSAPPFEEPGALAAYSNARRVRWAVVPESRAAAFRAWSELEGSFGSSLIFRIPPLAAAENSEQQTN